MAYIHKSDEQNRSFLAELGSPLTESDRGQIVAVSLDANGRVVKGTAAQTGCVGVIVPSLHERVPHPNVQVWTTGEVVDCEGLAAGTHYYAESDGSLGTTGTNPYVGHTVTADRLVLRVEG